MDRSSQRRTTARELLVALAERQEGKQSQLGEERVFETFSYWRLERVEDFLAEAEAPTVPRQETGYLVLPPLPGSRPSVLPVLHPYFLEKSGVELAFPALECASLEVVFWQAPDVPSTTLRLEPPSSLGFRPVASFDRHRGEHEFYHLQFDSEPRGPRGSHRLVTQSLTVPTDFPAFPIRADDFGSLLLALLVGLYGLAFYEGGATLELSLARDTQEGCMHIYEDLGYRALPTPPGKDASPSGRQPSRPKRPSGRHRR